MTSIKILPTPLSGIINTPSSKSVAHRHLICAALSRGTSVIGNVTDSADIRATCSALRRMGASLSVESDDVEHSVIKVTGCDTSRRFSQQDATNIIDAGESGSTLRFLIPLALCGRPITFTGRGQLGKRPLKAYYNIFNQHDIQYLTAGGNLPLTVNGTLRADTYEIPGNVSSQFISGMLFAMPLLSGDSVLKITTPLESRGYVSLTFEALARFGIHVQNHDFTRIDVPGLQKYKATDTIVESDYSQAAFWLVAGALGEGCTCSNLRADSQQGDKEIVNILQKMGVTVRISVNNISTLPSPSNGIEIDGTNCPDIIPVLAAFAAVSDGTTRIYGSSRLRLKESDRLAAMVDGLKRIGANIKPTDDGMIITGSQKLRGGIIDSYGDHRIVMSFAAISSRCTSPLVINGCECVAKSYPRFWEDFKRCNGKIEQTD